MPNNVDFSIARFKHLNWRFRIRNFLDGKETLTPEQALNHRDCDLGKWFYTEGKKKYGHLSSVQLFEQEHIALHSIVREIIQAKEAENYSKAEALYQQLLEVSDRVNNYLIEAEKEINLI
ncbi:MAG: CZB domain-containing protein [Bacteroidia bacterium]|nr:CZB domain-containing protein [Bacteroidia bacterium]MDW8157489.1 CZB domain-containing protein [Bacteroidia bacterium]